MTLVTQIRELAVGDVETVSINFSDWLDGVETLATVDSAVCTSVKGSGAIGDVTLSNRAVRASEYTEAETGDTVTVGSAAAFDVSGQQANTVYYIDVTVTSTGNRTKVATVRLWVP